MVATLLRVKELALQWNAGYVFFRVDVRKAFDTMKHSCVLSMLLRQGISDQLISAIGRELGKTYQHIKLGTVPSAQPTRMYQGLKQGSPLSGQLFVPTLGERLQVLWRREGLGLWVDTVHLAQLLFADDLVIVARDGMQVLRMLQDLQEAIWELGLEVNPDKLS